MINAVTTNCLSAGYQPLKQCCDLLGKHQTDGDVRFIGRIGEARKGDLMVCCYHGISNDFVLKLDWKSVEGKNAIDLVVINGE